MPVGNYNCCCRKGFAMFCCLNSVCVVCCIVGLSGIDSSDKFIKQMYCQVILWEQMIPLFSLHCVSLLWLELQWPWVNEVRSSFKEIPGIMELQKQNRNMEKMCEIFNEVLLFVKWCCRCNCLICSSVVGFTFGPESIGGLLAGVYCFWCIDGIFQTMQVELGITLRNHSRKV